MKENRRLERRPLNIEKNIHIAIKQYVDDNFLGSIQGLVEGLIVDYLSKKGVSIKTQAKYMKNI